jgi:hypothetical protein
MPDKPNIVILWGDDVGLRNIIASQITDFETFPPRQKPASFNLDAVLENLSAPHGS